MPTKISNYVFRSDGGPLYFSSPIKECSYREYKVKVSKRRQARVVPLGVVTGSW